VHQNRRQSKAMLWKRGIDAQGEVASNLSIVRNRIRSPSSAYQFGKMVLPSLWYQSR
jgi:hypothetical protein